MTFDEWWAKYLSAHRVYWWDSFAEKVAEAAWNEARANQWQPIETAPKDGTEIIMVWPNGYMESDGLYESTKTAATHWMPLPEPPGEGNQ